MKNFESGELGLDGRENEFEDLSMCMESALYVMSQECIRMGVFREGEFSVNQVPIKLFNVLFDTGALQRSYISKSLVDAHRGQWKNAIRNLLVWLDWLIKPPRRIRLK